MENPVKATKVISLFISAIVVLGLVAAILLPSIGMLHGHKRHSIPSAMQTKMDHAKILIDNGISARRVGNLSKAKSSFKVCIRLHTIWDTTAECELAQIYDKEGKSDKAFTAYQQVFSQSSQFYSNFPNDVEALAHYGIMCAQRGQYTEAVRVYEQARKYLNPAPPVPLSTLSNEQAQQPLQVRAMLNVVRGIALEEQGKREDALAAYAEAAHLQPTQAVAQFYLGRALQRTGRKAEAQAAFTKAVQFGQGDVKAAAQKELHTEHTKSE